MKLLIRSRLFWLGLAVRVACLPFFGSYYLDELFIPFLDRAVLHPTHNPWDLSPAQFFPYGSVLYGLLFLPRWLAHAAFGQSALGATWLGHSLVRFPLLGLELVLLGALLSLAGNRRKEVLKWYWLNPIAIYVTYVHGQLDVAATAFTLLGIVSLLRQRLLLSAVAMAAATLCKFHVVALLPVLLVYLWNRHFAADALRRISLWAGIYGALTFAGFLPLLAADRLLYASTSSPEALRIFSAQLQLNGETLFLGVMAVLAVLGRLCLATHISDRGLVYGAGAVLGVLLLVTQPAPGWHLWVLPFLVLFHLTYLNMPRSPLIAFTAVYFVYYVGFRAHPDATASLYSGIVFTVMQTALAGLLASMWWLGVRKEIPLKGRAQPVLLGIAGDSGAGKNTLCVLILDVFNPKHTRVVEGDDYHKWERASVRWQDYTHLHPRANHLTVLEGHAKDLRQGLAILQPHYDHATGTFTEPREMKPGRAVVVQGLHTLYLRGLRDWFDLRVFLAPDERVRLHWKLSRDVRERGHSIEKVISSLDRRAKDSQAHISPQRQYADWIIEYFPVDHATREAIIAGHAPLIGVRHLVWNDAPVHDVAEALAALPGAKVSLENDETDLNRLILTFQGDEVAADQVSEIARKLFPDLRTLTRARSEVRWHGGLSGVCQLVLVALLRTQGRPLRAAPETTGTPVVASLQASR